MIHIQHFVFNDFMENTYILWDETRSCVIIDPGCNSPAERNDLLQFIKGNDLEPVLLLNTHCHIDHVLGNKWVKETFKVDFLMHKKEEVVLQTLESVGKMYGVFVEASPAPDRYVEAGEKVIFGNSSLSVFFTPGHSPGSISFYSETDKLMISGDVLFQSGIGRTDLPGGSYQQLMQSIFDNLMTLPEDTIVYSGHGPATTIGEEKRNNPFVLEYAATIK
ncbi:MAG: MBL fold metallo-hydrolase [Chitinophagaceae bacterium]|nr:MBL fold metallo-hydrolase [Chitinophagaceae bacterium]